MERAFKIVGSRAAMARELNLSQSACYQWEKCPPERVLDIENLTQQAGEIVTRYELRPDIFGKSPPSAAE
ncbi:MAG: transcriptional regulator [Terasakiella sp.]|uniref:transcriptional regulator n=1 Tax=unclassified Terasakiella TaxID=2614952 RepID=UPI003B009DB3